MTRRDYETIAAILNRDVFSGAIKGTQAYTFIRTFAKIAKKDNPMFNAELFFEACNMDKLQLG